MTSLFPYQVEGAEWLAGKKHALLADPMGLGKSAQAIRACDAVRAQTILVLCPASVRENWRREFNKFAITGRKIVVLFDKHAQPQIGAVNVASYDGATGPLREKLMALKYDVVIADEAHFCKTMTSKRTKALFGFKKDKGYVHRAERVWLLSGTPAPNNPFELYPMCRVLFGDSFLKDGKAMNKWDFIGRFCTTIDRGFGQTITGGKNLQELKMRLQPYVLRREKQSRPPIIDVLPLSADALVLPPDLEELAASVEEALDLWGDPLRAIQATYDHIAALRRALGLAKVAPLAEWVIDQLDSGLEKIVIFAYHTDVLAGLAKALSKVSQIAYIDGSTPATKRDHEVQFFRNHPECKVFIGQMQAAGTGVDGLQVAEQMVLAEYSWVPAENEQAIGRIDRTGQKGNPLIRYAVVAGSLDERIAAVASRKAADIKQVFA